MSIYNYRSLMARVNSAARRTDEELEDFEARFDGVLDIEAAQYQGAWNPSTNTPTLTDSDTPTTGDFYIVNEFGSTTIGGISDWKPLDRVCWNGAVWEKLNSVPLPQGKTRYTYLSTNPNIYADGDPGSEDPTGVNSGWYYRNQAGRKINWYLYGDTTQVENTKGEFEGFYAIVDLRSPTAYLYWTLYTRPQLDGGDASWYRSRISYNDESAVQAASGRVLIHSAGLDVSTIAPELPRVSVDIDPLTTNGPQADNEVVWLMALSTSSNYPEGYNEFVVEQAGFVFGTNVTEIDFVALPGSATEYLDYYKGAFDGAANFPPLGQVGQWLIETQGDQTYVWDGDTSNWVATGSAPSDSATTGSPYTYVYDGIDGSGYGFVDAVGFQNLPDGRLEANSNSPYSSCLANRVKFGTLVNPGDSVVLEGINWTQSSQFYRAAFFYAAKDHDVQWTTASRDIASYIGYYNEDASDAFVFGHNCYVRPYIGTSSYAAGMTGIGGSNYTPANQRNFTMEWRLNNDFKLELLIDGQVRSRSTVGLSGNFAGGIDLYILAKLTQVFPQPTGVAPATYSPTVPANYYMSQVDPGGAETNLVASGGGYWLYQNDAELDPADVPLTDQEALAAQSCRVFRDYTGYSLEDRIQYTRGVAEADTAKLDSLVQDAKAFFHSFDYTPSEIQALLTKYESVLQSMASGSVEVSLGALQAMRASETNTDEQDLQDYVIGELTMQLAKFPR